MAIALILITVILGVALGLWARSKVTKMDAKVYAKEIQKTYPSNEGVNASTESSAASELEKLVKLHDSGALTDEEFAAAKKKILG